MTMIQVRAIDRPQGNRITRADVLHPDAVVREAIRRAYAAGLKYAADPAASSLAPPVSAEGTAMRTAERDSKKRYADNIRASGGMVQGA